LSFDIWTSGLPEADALQSKDERFDEHSVPMVQSQSRQHGSYGQYQERAIGDEQPLVSVHELMILDT
jgi:hypothetical protein